MHSNPRAAAVALFGASVLYLLVVALHPTHGAGGSIHGISIAALIHAVALAAGPLYLFGVLVAAQRQGLDRSPVLLAVVFYAVGAVIGTFGPAINGFVAPQVLQARGEPAQAETLHAVGDLAFWIAQAAVSVHFAFIATAFLLFAAGWTGSGRLGQAVRAWGLLAGAGLLAWQVAGTGRIDVHALAAMVLAVGGWHVLLGLWLWREASPSAERVQDAGAGPG
jgi:hypothetical protein